jgi:hypothetical protein
MSEFNDEEYDEEFETVPDFAPNKQSSQFSQDSIASTSQSGACSQDSQCPSQKRKRGKNSFY